MPSLKMKTWLSPTVLGLASLLLWLTLSAKAQDCSDQATAHPAFKWTGTEPLVLLTEYNPWAMAIGSDTPTFALYADRTVIYWQGDRKSGEYVTAHLTLAQVSRWREAAHLDKFDQFKSCYSIFDGSDAPTNVLVVKTLQGFKSIEVYGTIRHLENMPERSLPADLQTAFKMLLGFSAEQATPWQPPYFEVIIWPFTYAKSTARWPSSFPGISDKNTHRTRNGYRLFLPITELDQYKAFIATIKPTQAVLLDARKWAVSARFPFPHEGALGGP
jgi:hypothetical protein